LLSLKRPDCTLISTRAPFLPSMWRRI
jgi:hypothetical protein